MLGKRQGRRGEEWCVASEDCAFGPIGFERVRDVRVSWQRVGGGCGVVAAVWWQRCGGVLWWQGCGGSVLVAVVHVRWPAPGACCCTGEAQAAQCGRQGQQPASRAERQSAAGHLPLISSTPALYLCSHCWPRLLPPPRPCPCPLRLPCASPAPPLQPGEMIIIDEDGRLISRQVAEVRRAACLPPRQPPRPSHDLPRHARS